ncbi:NUDIX hydrolase [Nocardioides sp. GXZ039]|uniref:NUDIX hydrolase n=1 Tax=Nocardioides sp. GXZ039 TaxID=3136018 RepID=UPI0030F3E6BD
MSLHDDAVAVLTFWAPPDDVQARLRDRYLARLDAASDAMTRDSRPEHLTASTLVFDPECAGVLLTLHAKAKRWFQFGGHPEADDATLLDAARREAVEESGLAPGDLDVHPCPVRLDAHPVPFCGPDGDVWHLDVMYAAVARPGARHAVSEESLDVAWWPADDVPNPELVPFVAAARKALAAQPGSADYRLGERHQMGAMARRGRERRSG